ncbi:hypothetical protein CWI37_0678p0020 [Hamiltosporidium tvaerminnensis]|uniref:MFS_1-like transporter n=1 Tax=Hamiltosporidium tvaerminnensis TaxID=1176355 RepID=A0A4Q9L4S3_9MICR|nr:hypothetical protein LUQ84_001303 [Hamiltosporidium tvaerminnensis]TBU01570.1 hypothetical protein CWI37_0678p0020 [Hamiltosporidium tvaerminnensis]
MKWYAFLVSHYICRMLLPMTSFIVPFLVEEKKFTNKDIFNKITPIFFISSLIASLIGTIIIEMIGNRNTLLIDTGLELLAYIIFVWMDERSFFFGYLVALLRGMSTSLTSVSKGVFLDIKPDETSGSKVIRNYNIFKKTIGIVSCLIGQDVYFSCKNHRSNLYFSMAMLILALCFGFLIGNNKKNDKKVKSLISEILNGGSFGKLVEIYNKDILFYSLMNIIGNVLYMCLAMYSANIFLERKKTVSEVGMMGKILYKILFPFRAISFSIVKILSFFDGSIFYQRSYEKNALIYGYIDALAKICGVIMSFLMTLIEIKGKYLVVHSLFLIVALIAAIYGLGYTQSLLHSYIIYIIGISLGTYMNIVSGSELAKDKEHLHIFYGTNLFISSVIHISISYITKWRNCSAEDKMFYYFKTCLTCFILNCTIGFLILKK